MGIIKAGYRIPKSCQEYGLKKPVIEESGNEFLVVIYRKSSIEIPESSTERDMEIKLLQLLCQRPKITQQELAEQLGYSKAWTRKLMKRLQQEGMLRREGVTKNDTWIVLR